MRLCLTQRPGWRPGITGGFAHKMGTTETDAADAGLFVPGPRHRMLIALLTTPYRLVQQHAATFIAQAEDVAGADMPQFVKDEFDAFLECGPLAHGLLRLRWGDCGHDKLIAFSCKRRGFCPSCGARRMAQTAAHLVDHVIPHVPVRQWVLSLLIPLGLILVVQPLPGMPGFRSVQATRQGECDVAGQLHRVDDWFRRLRIRDRIEVVRHTLRIDEVAQCIGQGFDALSPLHECQVFGCHLDAHLIDDLLPRRQLRAVSGLDLDDDCSVDFNDLNLQL